MTVGVLAFQGDFAEHIDILKSMNMKAIEVRSVEDLKKVHALIIPGGESTVIAKFLKETGVGEAIVRRGLPVFGTCAGAILVAYEASGKNAPDTLGLIDITVDRNAYGTQLDSFETSLKVKDLKKPIHVSFIRAPKITRIGEGVEVLASYQDFPVLVRQGNIFASTFHAEVRDEAALHALFLRSCVSVTPRL